MREMMVDESKLCFRRREALQKWSLSVALPCKAHVSPKQAGHADVIDGMQSVHHALEIVPDKYADRRPPEADMIQLFGPNTREIQASSDCESGESRIVLYPAQSCLRDGEQDGTIPGNTRRRIMNLRIVDSD